MKFSQLSFFAINTLAVLCLAPAIAFSQPGNRPSQLNFTEAQKQQMKTLQENSRTQINAILTPAQRTQLEASLKSGTKPRAAMQALNLSAEQKTKISAVKESVKTQRQALLTPEQKQKLEQMRANRPQLNLSAEQKQKMQALRQNTMQKVSAVLTPEQKAKLAEGKKEGGKKQGDRSMASLNLNDSQKAQIKTIREASKKEMESILTPAQLQQLKQRAEQRVSRRNQK